MVSVPWSFSAFPSKLFRMLHCKATSQSILWPYSRLVKELAGGSGAAVPSLCHQSRLRMGPMSVDLSLLKRRSKSNSLCIITNGRLVYLCQLFRLGWSWFQRTTKKSHQATLQIFQATHKWKHVIHFNNKNLYFNFMFMTTS